MARKTGLNRKEQIQCAKWLTEGIDPRDVAKKFHVDVTVVKKFTQAKLDAADEKARERAGKMNLISQKRRKKAEVLNEAISVGVEDDAADVEFK